MINPDPSSPHLQYLGGSFGRVSLLAPNVRFTPHARDCTQILLNVDAQALDVDIDGERRRLRTHQAVLIHPRQVYAVPGQPRRAPPGMPGAPGSILIKYQPMQPGLPARSNAVVQLDAHGRDRTRDLLAELGRAHPASGHIEQAIHGLFQTVSTAISEAGSAASIEAPGAPSMIETQIEASADTLVFDDINMFRAVGAAAQAHDISERHFFTLFKKATGLSPRAFYNMRRLEMAFALLLDTSYGIADIAYELGFSAPPHFTRFMRANTGWTPSAYRHAVSIMPKPLRLTLQHTVPFGRKSETRLRRLQ